MNDRACDLLVEIARLLRRFGPEPFEQLAREVSNAEFAASLERLLTGAAKNARVARRAPSGTKDVLADLKMDQPEKFAVLTELRQRLVEKQALPHLADVQAFEEKNGIQLTSGHSRARAIEGLVRALAPLPLDQVKRIAQSIPVTAEGRSDLKGWSDLIMERRPDRK